MQGFFNIDQDPYLDMGLDIANIKDHYMSVSGVTRDQIIHVLEALEKCFLDKHNANEKQEKQNIGENRFLDLGGL